MSKQFFVSNLVKAYSEDTFDLGILFQNYSATKEQLANLLTGKYNSIKESKNSNKNDKYST